MKLLPLGLDIAKLKFNACLRHEDGRLRHKVFANTTAGFALLSDWLAEQGVGSAHACMEATGTYYEALAAYLDEAGHTVSLRLAAAIKAYAQSHLSRTKTDRVDAALIASFCLEQRPPGLAPARATTA